MAVLQMQRISICALKRNRKAILEKVQSMGVMEISSTLEDDDVFRRMNTQNAKNSFDRAALSIDRALETLDKYAPEKKSMFSSLAGKKLVSKSARGDASKEQDRLVKTAGRIQALDKERAETKADIVKLETGIESLTPWLPLDIPMNEKGTEHTAVIIGTMPGKVGADGVLAAVAESAPNVDGLDVHIVSSGKDMTYLAIICLRGDADTVEDALRAHGFARPSQAVSTVPAEAASRMRAEIKEKEKHIEEIEEKIVSLAPEREKLKVLGDYYRVRSEKYAVLGELPQSERTFIISGYIPEKHAEKTRETLEKSFDCVVEIEDLKEDEESPVLLKNNAFAASAEGILESYGLPAKGEIDPTGIMAVFYVFLFGLMLSDAAYGAIISAVCGIALLKFKRMEEGMKKALSLFFWCGLSTLFWGVMFGGYFGDVVSVVSRTFFGREVEIPALWFVPLKDPMRLLIYSMLFGVIHLFTGLGIKGYMLIRDKKYFDCFCDVGLWYMLLIGLIIMFLPSDIFASIAQTKIVFPMFVSVLGKVFAIVGALGILVMSGRRKKNIGLRLALGAYDLYNVSGWLSDVLSYSRLLALGLATGVIAQVVNQMGTMAGKGVVGTIVFIVVFIVGHSLNLAINLLGTYVHTNRLQFVEFFGKFYEGGGRAFKPFKENTKYTDIEEEN